METQSRVSGGSEAQETVMDVAIENIDWAQSAIASIGCRKEDPEYVKELFEGAKEARRRINEEFLRELDEQGRK